MKGQVNVYYAKGLFKSSVSVGAGLVIGKHIGDLVGAVIDGITSRLIQGMAEHGNKIAQKACEKSGVKYAEVNIGNDPRQ